MELVAVIVGTKGRGSNMRALVEAGREPDSPFEVRLVAAPSLDAPAVRTAEELGVEVLAFSPKEPGFAKTLVAELRARSIGWICLAGYMRLLPPEVLRAFPGRILNIHPALLPKHGGRGMYGMHVHESVIASGDSESGCTVHYVDEVYDGGMPVMWLKCPVNPGDDAESLAHRVLELEHRAYPRALRMAIARARQA